VFAPEELADLRDVSDSSLPDVCDVIRNVRTRQPNGTYTDTEQTVQSQIRCRKVPLLQTPVELLAEQTQTTRYVTTFQLSALAAPIHADDIILHEGKRYEVAGIAVRSDEMLIHVFVYDDSKGTV
jgi:hypothetical protein